MSKQAEIILNPEAGNLPLWAEQEAERLAKLKTFQPRGWNATGASRAYKGLRKVMLAAGLSGDFLNNVLMDISDLARLKAFAAN